MPAPPRPKPVSMGMFGGLGGGADNDSPQPPTPIAVHHANTGYGRASSMDDIVERLVSRAGVVCLVACCYVTHVSVCALCVCARVCLRARLCMCVCVCVSRCRIVASVTE